MSAWKPDRLLAGFEALELSFADDYDGAVLATLVRLPAGDARCGLAIRCPVLSRSEIREAVFRQLFAWAARLEG